MSEILEFSSKTKKQNVKKFGRFCINCGSTLFEIEETLDGEGLLVVCAGCGYEMQDLEVTFKDD